MILSFELLDGFLLTPMLSNKDALAKHDILTYSLTQAKEAQLEALADKAAAPSTPPQTRPKKRTKTDK